MCGCAVECCSICFVCFSGGGMLCDICFVRGGIAEFKIEGIARY